jgi:hypothetical protein
VLKDLLRGAAHIFEFAGVLAPRYEPVPDDVARALDELAIASDWEVVGRDMQRAIEEFEGNA